MLARSAHCPYAALAYGDPEDPDVVTLQPHPEFGPAFMDELLALRAGTAFPEAEAGDRARLARPRPVESAAWARLIVDYLRRAAATRAAAA